HLILFFISNPTHIFLPHLCYYLTKSIINLQPPRTPFSSRFSHSQYLNIKNFNFRTLLNGQTPPFWILHASINHFPSDGFFLSKHYYKKRDYIYISKIIKPV
ncbi:hypothetical protein V8G54_019966, partial [Vigna mungo]